MRAALSSSLAVRLELSAVLVDEHIRSADRSGSGESHHRLQRAHSSWWGTRPKQSREGAVGRLRMSCLPMFAFTNVPSTYVASSKRPSRTVNLRS